MADYKYVFWGERTPIEAEKLKSMSESIQHSKDIADAAPRGVLYWLEKTADFDLAGKTVGSSNIVSNISFNFTVEANRIIRFHYHCAGVSGDTVANTSGRLKLRLLIDGAEKTVRELDLERNYFRSIDGIDYVTDQLTAGQHSVAIHAVKVVGATGSNMKLRAGTFNPMQFWIEDMGETIAQI